MSSHPIRRLHADLQRLSKAEHAHTKAAGEVHQDKHELKSDVNRGKRLHDRFDKNHKELKKDHAKLLDARAAEAKALQPLQAQEASLQAEYDASVDPTTGQGDAALLEQLDAVKQQEADVHAHLDPRIAEEAKQVESLRNALARGRLDIHNTRNEIKHDRSELKHDDKKLATTREHVHAARHKALKDLTPAEYKMDLKSTNKARHALGLKSVHHVIRPDAGGQKVVDLAKKYLGKYESQLQAAGVTQPCPLNESCANFVTSMLSKSGAINFRTLSVSTLNTDLRARGWHVVSLKDAKPGDVWICNGAHGESHTEIVASNHNGHVTLIGSNNHPNPSNQQINYDSYSANISGSFILAPPHR